MPRSKRLAVSLDSPPYQCCYCLSDVRSGLVKCAECVNVELCLQCFSSGVEVGKHKKQHKYSVINCGNFPIFKTENPVWTSNHEIQLLCAILRYGLGNWTEIAASVNNDSSPEDVQHHYNELYVHGTIGTATWKLSQRNSITDHTKVENGSLLSRLTDCVVLEEIPIDQCRELGYMPLRDDFELEYDNEAESLVSELVFSNEDDELDKRLKLAQVNIYNEHLKKRLLVKKVARQHNEVQNFFNFAVKSKASPGKKQRTIENSKSFHEFQEKMQPFARFYSEAELKYFFESVQKEKDLKSRILELIALKSDNTNHFGNKYCPKRNFNGIKRKRGKNKKLKFTWKKRGR